MVVQRPAYQFREQQIPIFFDGVAPANRNSAQVILHTEPTGPDIERRGSILVCNPRAIQALTEFLSALVSGGLTVEVDPLDPKPVAHGRSFQELGFKDRPILSGTQAFSLKFDLAQLGGRPKDLIWF